MAGLSMDYWFYNVKSRAIAWHGWEPAHPVSWEFFLHGSLNLAMLDLREPHLLGARGAATGQAPARRGYQAREP